MPEGTTVKTGTSYIGALFDRMNAVDLSNVSPATGPEDENYVAKAKRRGTYVAVLPDSAKRLWALRHELFTERNDVRKKGTALAGELAKFIASDEAADFDDSHPQAIELDGLQERMDQIGANYDVIDRLFRAEVLSLFPDIPKDATLTVIEDLQLYWEKPREHSISVAVIGGLGLGGLLAGMFGEESGEARETAN